MELQGLIVLFLFIGCTISQTTAFVEKSKTTEKQLKEALAQNQLLKKENKRLKLMVSSKPKAKTASDTDKEKEDLKKLLKETTVMNKRLRKQNKRQKQVWLALEQMCKALGSMKSDSEKSRNETVTPDRRLNGTNETKGSSAASEDQDFRIQYLTVSSKVLEPSGTKAVSVEYTARGTPVIEWYVMLGQGAMYRTAGETKYNKETKTYTSSLPLVDHILTSRHLILRSYDPPDLTELDVNLTAILTSNRSEVQSISPVHFTIADHQSPMVAPFDDSFNASFYINGSISNLTVRHGIDAYLTGLNMSVSPPEMFEIYSFNDEINTTVRNISSSSLEVAIQLGQTAQYGGVITLSFETRLDRPGLYEYIKYGRFFNILSSKTRSVVPPKAVGVYPLRNITLLPAAYQSITCGAMSDSRPVVKLERHSRKGVTELNHETELLLDEFSVIKAYTIYANDSNAEGKYICRASNNHSTVESVTEVMVYEESSIDDSQTGVKVKNKKKVEIGCQASGKPIPRLELRLFKEWGPDLAQSPRYKADRSQLSSTTAKLIVTISPVDPDIVKVFCVAYNENQYEYQSSVIQVFPDPPHYNWDLYHELEQEQGHSRF